MEENKMSLLARGSTIWKKSKSDMEALAKKIGNYTKMFDETANEMYTRVKETWPHKIVDEFEEYMKTLDPDARVITLHIESWGYAYYVEVEKDRWQFIYDVNHQKCQTYAVEDFKEWVQEFGTEFAQVMADELEGVYNEECAFEEQPELEFADVEFSTGEFGKMIIADIELKEDDF